VGLARQEGHALLGRRRQLLTEPSWTIYLFFLFPFFSDVPATPAPSKVRLSNYYHDVAMSSEKGGYGHSNGSAPVRSSGESSEPQAASPLTESSLNAILRAQLGRTAESLLVAVPPPSPPSPPCLLRRIDPVSDLRQRCFHDSSQQLKDLCDAGVKLTLFCISHLDSVITPFLVKFNINRYDHPYRYIKDARSDLNELYHVVEKYQHRYLRIDDRSVPAAVLWHEYYGKSTMMEVGHGPVYVAGQEIAGPQAVAVEEPKRKEATVASFETSQRNDKPLNQTNPVGGDFDSTQKDLYSAISSFITKTHDSPPGSRAFAPISSTHADIPRDPKVPGTTVEENIPRSTSPQCSKMSQAEPSSTASTCPPVSQEGHPPLSHEALLTINAAMKASIPAMEEFKVMMHGLRYTEPSQLRAWKQIKERLPSVVYEMRKTVRKATLAIAAELNIDLRGDPHGVFAGRDVKDSRNTMRGALPTMPPATGPSLKGKERAFDVSGENSRTATTNGGDDNNDKQVATHDEDAMPPTESGAGPVLPRGPLELELKFAYLVTRSRILPAWKSRANFEEFRNHVDAILDAFAAGAVAMESVLTASSSPTSPIAPGRSTAEKTIASLEDLRNDAAFRAEVLDPDEENPISLLDDDLRQKLGWKTGTTSQLGTWDRILGRSEFGDEFDREFDRLDKLAEEERRKTYRELVEAFWKRRNMIMTGEEIDNSVDSSGGEKRYLKDRLMKLDDEERERAGDGVDGGHG